jgi:hypothetical protein
MTPANAAPCNMETLPLKIAKRAYALWEIEGKPHGRDLDHWCRAECEVMAAGAEAKPSTKPTSSWRSKENAG